MVTSVTDQQDGFSDYGSDFTPDEEEILRGLLQQVPDPEDNPNADIDLLLRNNQDDEPPRGAKIPRRLGYEQKGSTSHAPECSITVQFDHDTPPPNGTSCVRRASNTD